MRGNEQTMQNPTRLLALVAVFAMCLGPFFGWTRIAFADDAMPINITELCADDLEEPEIGAMPDDSCNLTLCYSNERIYDDNKSDWITDPVEINAGVTWIVDGHDYTSDTPFEDGHTYVMVVDMGYYLNSLYHDKFDCDNAKGYVNEVEKGEPSAYVGTGNRWFVRLKCTWTLHELVFNANGGTGNSKTQTTYEEYSVALKKNDDYTKFTREGHTFAGWNTKADGSGTHYDDGADYTYKAEDGTTLYAEWTPNTYTIDFVNDDGTVLQSGTVAYKEMPEYKGDTPTKNETDEATYVFKGWDPTIVEATEDATYKATYDEVKKTATLTFDLAGGNYDGKTDDVTITANVGDTVKLLAAPTRDRYAFKCWKGSEYAAGDEYKVEGDHTFTADWKKKNYPKPDMSNSKGGSFASTSDEITYTVSQEVPDWASSVRTWVDLESVLQYTSDASSIAVATEDGAAIDAKVSIDGQTLTVMVADATALRGKTLEFSYKAKLRSGANLDPYLNPTKDTASVPYQAHTVFDNEEANAVKSEQESVKFKVGSSGSGSSSSGSTTSASTATRSTTPATGDVMSVASVVATASAGMAVLVEGWRRRR